MVAPVRTTNDVTAPSRASARTVAHSRYKHGMHTEHIQYRGRYEYADRESLERALSTARATLGNDTLGQIATWLRFFVCRGTSLTVNMMVPDRSEHRFAAANVFLVLAHAATGGQVDAYPETCPVDRFDPGDLDI